MDGVECTGQVKKQGPSARAVPRRVYPGCSWCRRSVPQVCSPLSHRDAESSTQGQGRTSSTSQGPSADSGSCWRHGEVLHTAVGHRLWAPWSWHHQDPQPWVKSHQLFPNMVSCDAHYRGDRLGRGRCRVISHIHTALYMRGSCVNSLHPPLF